MILVAAVGSVGTTTDDTLKGKELRIMWKALSIGLVSNEAATIYPQDGDVVPYETALATTDDELKNKELRV